MERQGVRVLYRVSLQSCSEEICSADRTATANDADSFELNEIGIVRYSLNLGVQLVADERHLI
jgi:hypothetical protein